MGGTYSFRTKKALCVWVQILPLGIAPEVPQLVDGIMRKQPESSEGFKLGKLVRPRRSIFGD